MSKHVAVAAIVGVTSLAPVAAQAQQLSDKWEFNAILYGWLPDISGHTTFPTGRSASINVDASKIIDALNFTVMGTFQAQKGRWGVFTDVIYLDVGGSTSKSRNVTVDGQPLPVGVTADAQLDLKSVVWTLAGSYRAVADPGVFVDVFAGARLIELKQALDWQLSGDFGDGSTNRRAGTSDIKITKTDAIIGAKGQVALGADQKWFVPYYVDVGTGQSKLTWQGITGIGYKFDWGKVYGVWRYLDYDFKSGSNIADVNFSGPAIGVSFSW